MNACLRAHPTLQYIVKVPHSGAASAFAWHRDKDWLPHNDADNIPYVSVTMLPYNRIFSRPTSNMLLCACLPAAAQGV